MEIKINPFTRRNKKGKIARVRAFSRKARQKLAKKRKPNPNIIGEGKNGRVVKAGFGKVRKEMTAYGRAKKVLLLRKNEADIQRRAASLKIAPKVYSTSKDGAKITMERVEQQAKNVANLPKTAVNLGRETRRTVQEGLNTPNDPNSKLNQGARWLARQRVKMEKRAREDMKKLGFEQNLSDVGLIEFAKTQRRKKRTAAERAAISQGLREYYATQPKPKKSVLDKVDRGALSVNRVTRTTSNILSTAAMGLSLAGQLKALTYKPSRGERIFQNVSAGAGLLSTVSGAYRGFGTGTRSFAGSANIYDDLRIGAKNRRFGLTEQRLGLERDKQVLAKDRAKSYRIIANTSAKSNSPGGTKYEDMVTRRGKFEKTYGTDVIPNIKANLRKKPKER